METTHCHIIICVNWCMRENEHTAVQLRRRRGLVNIGERTFVRDTSPQNISVAVNPPPPYINHPPSSLQKKKQTNPPSL